LLAPFNAGWILPHSGSFSCLASARQLLTASSDTNPLACDLLYLAGKLKLTSA